MKRVPDTITMHLLKFIPASLIAIFLIQTNAICQPSGFPTNFTYFKANIVNDTNNLANAVKAYRQGKISKEEVMVVTLATLNDEPIILYGKLEDQFSNAIENATINFDVRVYNGLQSTVNRGQVVSDKMGLFEVINHHGQDLNITPHKQGYALASTRTFFNYSRLDTGYFVPYSNSPVIVKMWKIQGAEPLAVFDQQYKLHYTANPIFFDFIKGTFNTNSGDVQITVNRPPGIISQRNPQKWSIIFEVINGGIMDSSDEQTTYFAPESGYQPSETISSVNKLPSHGVDGFITGFYVKSRNGQVYSKLRLEFAINKTQDDFMYFHFAGIANTNFSRNWEGAGGTYLNPGY